MMIKRRCETFRLGGKIYDERFPPALVQRSAKFRWNNPTLFRRKLPESIRKPDMTLEWFLIGMEEPVIKRKYRGEPVNNRYLKFVSNHTNVTRKGNKL